MAALLLGQAQLFTGEIAFVALDLLALSIGACCMAVASFRPAVSPSVQSSVQKPEVRGSLTSRFLETVPSLTRFSSLNASLLGALLVLALWQLVNVSLVMHGILVQQKHPSFVLSLAPPEVPMLCLMALGIIAIVWSLKSPWGWRLQIVAFLAAAVWVVKCQKPEIDVHIFQHDSSAALLHGVNPYSITFPNPYYAKSHSDISPFYGKGVSVNGVLQFGYVYMPLTLLLTLPGYLLGDVRLAQVLAVALAALFVTGVRPKAEKALLGSLFLWTPMVLFVLFLSWTDPFCVLTLSFVLFCAIRYPKLLPLACGLFLASKQYTLLTIPLMWLLVPLTMLSQEKNQDASSTRLSRGEHWKLYGRFMGKALLTFAVVTLPLALWNFKAFFYSTMLLQFKQPFRPDSLSFMALWFNLGWGLWSSAVPFGLMLIAMIWVLKRAPRDEVGFLTGVSLIFLVFFAFNKQAFLNYYYFVIGAMWCAVMAIFERSLQEKNQITPTELEA